MNDDVFFFAIAAVAIAAQIAVSSQRTSGQHAAAAPVTARQAHGQPKAEVRQMESITVVGRASDGAFPADQMARVEHDQR
jgi:hypothetical protein